MIHGSEKGRRVVIVCFWLILVCVLLANKDELTVEKIVSFSPENILLTILIILVLFAVKGCTALINANVLYISCGIMFSLPLAIAVNLLGSFIMTSVPFFTGRKGGTALMEKLTQKYKKLEPLYSSPSKSPFLFTLMLRTFGILPCEIISMYLGACQLGYKNYICGTLLGLLPSIIAFSVMGEYASDLTSPQFIAAAVFKITAILATLIAGGIWKRKRKVA